MWRVDHNWKYDLSAKEKRVKTFVIQDCENMTTISMLKQYE